MREDILAEARSRRSAARESDTFALAFARWDLSEGFCPPLLCCLDDALRTKAGIERASRQGKRLGRPVGDPSAVPAVVYARAYLERARVWASIQSKLVPMLNVRAALAAVESGDVDAAIVYATDAAIATRSIVAFEVPAAQSPAIVYPAALVRGGGNPTDARRFLAFLQSEAGRTILRNAGFALPAPQGR